MHEYKNVDLSINKLDHMKSVKDYSKLTTDEVRYITNYFNEYWSDTNVLAGNLLCKLQDKLNSIVVNTEETKGMILRIQVLYLNGYSLICFEDTYTGGDVELIKKFDEKLKTVDVTRFMLHEMKINTENTKKVLDSAPMDSECICFITTTEKLPEGKTVNDFDIFDLTVSSEISWLEK